MSQRGPDRALPARLSDIVLSYSSEESWFDGSSELEIWHVSADVVDYEDSESKSHVGDFEFIVVDPYKTDDLWMLLDGYDRDMTDMAAVLLEPGHNDLRDDLWERAQGVGVGILVLARAQLAEDWQGHGVGAALAGKAIRRLGTGYRGVACYPMPLPRNRSRASMSESERAAGSAALAKTWARLGFEPYRNGVMILDLGLQSATAALLQCIADAEALPQPGIDR